jgi:hypothetical protein
MNSIRPVWRLQSRDDLSVEMPAVYANDLQGAVQRAARTTFLRLAADEQPVQWSA